MPPSPVTPRLAAATRPTDTSIAAETVASPCAFEFRRSAMLLPGGSRRSNQSSVRMGARFAV